MSKKQPIVTPCISVCTMDEETGLCRGCHRTADEVRDWLKYTHEQRLQIMETLKGRVQ